MKLSKQAQQGFTLIELVVVIVILGILAATALPKFIDLSSNAEAAAVQGVAGGLTAAFATNYAGYAVGGTAKGVRISGAVVVSAVAASVMLGSSLPIGYAVYRTGAAINCSTAGLAFSIAVSKTNSTATPKPSAAATLICTG